MAPTSDGQCMIFIVQATLEEGTIKVSDKIDHLLCITHTFEDQFQHCIVQSSILYVLFDNPFDKTYKNHA